VIKKIDKLILSSFIGPFILTFLVVIFILLLRQMLMYFDDIIGKGLDMGTLFTLLFYFALSITSFALPLGVLLSALITYGNLGEHFEITAVKSLGISLTRSLKPIFWFTMLITLFAFWANNYLVPMASLEAYSLLYDIKQKKPALDLREGYFYNGIPDISIKVAKKYSDGVTLKNVIIYDHRGRNGNKQVIIADSGKMYTVLNNQYLKLELFRGYDYEEGGNQSMTGQSNTEETFNKTKFDKTQIVLDLSSFGFSRTDKKWFASNRIMRNMSELVMDMDSVSRLINDQRIGIYQTMGSFFSFHFKRDSVPMPKELKDYRRRRDSLALVKARQDTAKKASPSVQQPTYPYPAITPVARVKLPGSITPKETSKSDSIYSQKPSRLVYTSALNRARSVKTQIQNLSNNVENYRYEYRVFQIQWHKILANSIACIAMFLIGAPLGAIIKKGGLGFPVLASIFFFIVFYVLSLIGEKWARQESVHMLVGMWAPNLILFAIGFIFLRQARADARLFDGDFYNVMIDRLKQRLPGKKQKKLQTNS
jgi:lipopolysaccharide export system permease protein